MPVNFTNILQSRQGMPSVAVDVCPVFGGVRVHEDKRVYHCGFSSCQ